MADSMTEDELKAALSAARDRMLNDEDTYLSEKRRNNLDRYLGEPDGRERPGYSQYVTREVFEAVQWIMPALLRTFTAGDRVVEFEPVGPEDEEQAAQETDIVNHFILKENSGYLNFYEWIWDILLYPNGYAKVWAEKKTKVKKEIYEGLSAIQLQMVAATPNVEIIESTEYYHTIMTPQGPVEEPCYDIKIKITEEKTCFRWGAVPPEQIGVDSECTSVDVDEARFVRHACLRTKSELIEMGYDAKALENVATWSDSDEWNTERVNRHADTMESRGDDEAIDPSTELYELEEWYGSIDFDGDGIAERRKIDMIGGEIFGNEEDDFQPIISCSAIPMPHRHDGLAWVESVTPIQELSTFLQRAENDNIARTNRPRKYISESAITDDGLTIEQLLDVDSEAIIVRGDPNAGITPEQHQPIIQEILAVHQTVKDQLQMRTGVAPGVMMDADVLQKTTEGAFTDAMDAASQLVEQLTRTIAEVGVKPLMIKAHRLIKEHQDKPKSIKIRGKWIDANPMDWKDRENVTVNVGLGYDDRRAQKQSAMEMITMQMQLMPGGFVQAKQMMNSLEDFVESLGRKGVERYFSVPQPQHGQQQPDPLTMAQIQALGAEVQRKNFETQSKEQRENAKLDAELENKNADTQGKLATAAEKAFKAGSAQIKQEAERMSPEFGSD